MPAATPEPQEAPEQMTPTPVEEAPEQMTATPVEEAGADGDELMDIQAMRASLVEETKPKRGFFRRS
jgi:hypothetical protein